MPCLPNSPGMNHPRSKRSPDQPLTALSPTLMHMLRECPSFMNATKTLASRTYSHSTSRNNRSTSSNKGSCSRYGRPPARYGLSTSRATSSAFSTCVSPSEPILNDVLLSHTSLKSIRGLAHNLPASRLLPCSADDKHHYLDAVQKCSSIKLEPIIPPSNVSDYFASPSLSSSSSLQSSRLVQPPLAARGCYATNTRCHPNGELLMRDRRNREQAGRLFDPTASELPEWLTDGIAKLLSKDAPNLRFGYLIA